VLILLWTNYIVIVIIIIINILLLLFTITINMKDKCQNALEVLHIMRYINLLTYLLTDLEKAKPQTCQSKCSKIAS